MAAKRVLLRPNYKRILETILYIISEWPGMRGRPTQYEIVKSVFIADMKHVNEYGRPITFDNYSALPFGPVPENTYDAIKPNYNGFQSRFGISGRLWDIEDAPQISPGVMLFGPIHRPVNMKVLSRTDIDCLNEAMRFVADLGFAKVRDWTHDHVSYKKAWDLRGTKRSSPMLFDDLLEEQDPELVAELSHASKFMQ